MPELPEVETIRRVLEPQLQNRTIEKVTVNHKDAVAYPSVDDFCLGLTGQMVSHIQRRGKFLIICMKSGDRVILHLRMTGGLLFTPKNYPEEKYTHLIFHFDQGQKLLFSDMRRFGRFWFLKKEEKDTFSGIAKLGIEPFDPKLSADYLKTYLGIRKKAIKTCLLDQSIIAGIGNIYSDEILFAAKILPSRPANSLTDKEWKCLAVTIPERLEYFIENNASTNWFLALVALAVIIIFNIWGKGMFKIIPILMGVVISYVVALIMNAMGITNPDGSAILNFSSVSTANWIVFRRCSSQNLT